LQRLHPRWGRVEMSLKKLVKNVHRVMCQVRRNQCIKASRKLRFLDGGDVPALGNDFQRRAFGQAVVILGN